MFAPSDETITTVREWLVDSGIPAERITHSDNKGWLAFDISAQQAESLLHTEYYVYEHTSYGHIETACEQCVASLDFFLACLINKSNQVPSPEVCSRAR